MSIKEKDNRNSFIANGYKFQVFKGENNDYQIKCKDFISDKYDLKSVQFYLDNYNDEEVYWYNYVVVKFSCYLSNEIEMIRLFAKLIDNIANDFSQFIRMEIDLNKLCIIVYFHTPTNKDTSDILDFCILLNTYKNFFIKKYEGLNIIIINDLINIFKIERYFSIMDLASSYKSIDYFMKHILERGFVNIKSSLYVTELVKINLDNEDYNFIETNFEYNYYFTHEELVYELDYVYTKLNDEISKY